MNKGQVNYLTERTIGAQKAWPIGARRRLAPIGSPLAFWLKELRMAAIFLSSVLDKFSIH